MADKRFDSTAALHQALVLMAAYVAGEVADNRDKTRSAILDRLDDLTDAISAGDPIPTVREFADFRFHVPPSRGGTT